MQKFPNLDPNDNCLTNIACPACGNREHFRIEMKSGFTLLDAGTDVLAPKRGYAPGVKTRKEKSRAPVQGRRVQLSAEDLKLISENQRLAGFSGVITEATAAHRPDMDEIAKSARRFGAQIPSPHRRMPRPVIKKFGDLKVM